MSLAIVKSARAVWVNVPDKEERAFRISNEVAARLGGAAKGWGVFRKTGGAGFRYQGKLYSLDLIFNRDTDIGVDVLKNAENTADAVWQVKSITKLQDWENAWTPPFTELLSGVIVPPVDEDEDGDGPSTPAVDVRAELDRMANEVKGLAQATSALIVYLKEQKIDPPPVASVVFPEYESASVPIIGRIRLKPIPPSK